MSPAASGSWLTRLNTWRGSTGVSALTENTTWSQGDYAHSLYMVKNDLVTHYETPGVPYYTAAGNTAAQDSNINVSSTTASTDDQAIDWWMGAPFHAMNLMDPRLTQTGFGSYRQVKSGWQMGATVDVLRGNSFTGGQFPVFFPGNGTTEPLTSYSGYESPDPLQACPGYSMPTGLPVFVEVGGNVATTAGTVHSFTGNGVPLAHCVIDSTNANLRSYMTARGGVIVIPRQPLQTGVHYVVTLSVNGAPYTWSFTVGPFVPPCTSATLTPSTPAPVVVGTLLSFTAGSAGCANPQYEFWIQYPGGTWNLKQGFGSPAFSWNTAGMGPGVYTIHSWVNNQGTGHDAIGSATVTLTGCTSASLTPPTPIQPAGSTLTFSAGSGGCPNPLYEFWVQYPSGTWYLKQNFGAAGFTWDTTGVAPGAYTVHAWANQQGAAPTLEVYGSSAVTLTGCTAATLSPSSASQPASSILAFTAGSTGCPNPRYEFFVLYPNGTWNLKQGWGGPGFSWDTAGLAPGIYTIHAWVNNQGTGHDDIGSASVTLTGCTAASLTPSTGSAVGGAAVPFTAASAGCPNPVYEFWLLDPKGTWHLMQPFGVAGWTWNSAGWAKGTYTIHLWANQQGAETGKYETIGSATYSLT